MKPVLVGAVSLIAAAAMPALLVAGWYAIATMVDANEFGDPYAWLRIRSFAALALLIAASHVFILGAPALVLFRVLRRISGWTATIWGFVLGFVPTGVLSWPHRFDHASASYDNVATLVNGIPTLAGWLSWIYGAGIMGLLGAVGGLSFWLIWQRCLRVSHS